MILDAGCWILDDKVKGITSGKTHLISVQRSDGVFLLETD